MEADKSELQVDDNEKTIEEKQKKIDPNDTTKDENNEIKEDPSVYDVFYEWSQGTSVHGLVYVTDNVHFRWYRQVVWALLVAIGTILMIWQIQDLVSSYREYSVIQSTRLIVPASLPFPDVTVCNANPTLHSKTKTTTSVSTEEELRSISQPFDNFMWLTYFNLHPLEPIEQYWAPVWTPFGQCWKFSTSSRVDTSGFFGGLKFVANIDHDEYLDTTEQAGIFLFVTQPNTTILFDELDLVALAPGRSHLVYLEKTVVNRERRHPWTYCDDSALSQATCRSACFHQAIRETCKCRQWGDPEPDLLFCDDDDDCPENLPVDAFDDCDCSLQPCFEEQYKVTASAATPAVPFSVKEVELLNKDYDLNITLDDYYANVVEALINFASIREEIITEKRAQSFLQLLSSIGGTMGLYVGISAISLLEIFGELFLLRFLPRYFNIRKLYGIGSKSE